MIFNFLLLAFAMMIWGLGFIATRWALTGLDPYWTIALRFLLAGSLGLPFLIYKRTFFKNRSWLIIGFLDIEKNLVVLDFWIFF